MRPDFGRIKFLLDPVVVNRQGRVPTNVPASGVALLIGSMSGRFRSSTQQGIRLGSWGCVRGKQRIQGAKPAYQAHSVTANSNNFAFL